MVNDFDGPSQTFVPVVKCGVTVIVANTGRDPVLMAANDAILPVPVAASPMDGVLFVQL